jgi:hypothetical protein
MWRHGLEGPTGCSYGVRCMLSKMIFSGATYVIAGGWVQDGAFLGADRAPPSTRHLLLGTKGE